MKNYVPKDITIATTYRCNSRCRMCNIWQIENPADLPLEYFYNLNPEIKYINLSGGEPFLRADLPEIVGIIKKKASKASVIISSNGFATELIVDQMKKIFAINPLVGVRISVDGMAETHNQVRGLDNIFERAINTIDELKKIGIKNLGFSFTMMDFNVRELPVVYRLAKKKGIELALALVQNSEIYFQKNNNTSNDLDAIQESLDYVIKEELSSWNVKKWLRAFYDYGLLVYAKEKRRLLPSGAGFDSAFIDPVGCVYPSNLINLPMGNIGQGGLLEVFNSKEAESVRERIKKEGIKESWIICTIRGEFRKNIWTVFFWILKNKFFGQYK